MLLLGIEVISSSTIYKISTQFLFSFILAYVQRNICATTAFILSTIAWVCEWNAVLISVLSQRIPIIPSKTIYTSELRSSVSINEFRNIMKFRYAVKIILCSLLSCHSLIASNKMRHPRSLISRCHDSIKIVHYRQVCDKFNSDLLPLLNRDFRIFHLSFRESIISLLCLTYYTSGYKISDSINLSLPKKILPEFI